MSLRSLTLGMPLGANFLPDTEEVDGSSLRVCADAAASLAYGDERPMDCTLAEKTDEFDETASADELLRLSLLRLLSNDL